MTIRHLKTFIKVCELESISSAAEELNVAQPSVSQTIKELENYYNISLFNRTNRKLVLTKEGEELLMKAREVIDAFDDFEATAYKIEKSPVINIGASITFGSLFLPEFISQIKKEIPGIDPFVYIDLPLGLQDKVLKGDVDFAITEAQSTSKSIKSIVVGEDNLDVVCGINYNAPHKIKIKDLVNYDLLVREPTSAIRRILDNALLIEGIKITKPRMESTSNVAIISMAVNNEGIAILPHDLVANHLKNKTLRELKLDISLDRKLYLISHKNKKLNTVGRKAYQHLVKLVKVNNNN